MSKEICIGIDLGTTNSCIAHYKSKGNVEIIVNENGNRTTPSYVSFQGNERYIGDAAKKNSGQNPKNTIYDVKRLIGNNFTDKNIQSDLRHLSYKIVSDDNNKPLIEVDYMDDKKLFHPEEISSMILSKLKDIASAYAGKEVKKAVITVPAYFNDSQRQATKDAGSIAGLDVIRIINEPTAAAIAYGLDAKGERNVLVYDLGGGTLDVTILNMSDGIFEVKSTSGDTHLGGEDFDNKLKDYCFMKFCDKKIFKSKLTDTNKNKLFELFNIKTLAGIQNLGSQNIRNVIDKTNNIDNEFLEYLNKLVEVNKLYENVKLMQRLKTICEETKKTLSTTTNTNIIYDNFYNGEDLNVKITRSKFETICNTEFNRCMMPVDMALQDAKMGAIQIDDVVLVGGSIRIPRIQELLNDRFPDKLRSNINPDEAVAFGAAINAAIITDTGDYVTDGLVLIDVTPLSLGLETVGGAMEVMIHRNTTIPAESKQTFSTHTDNQPSVTVKIFEGERTMTKDNKLLGKFELTDLPLLPKGKPRIEVTFSVDTNGIMSVSAKELSTCNENALIIKNEKGRLTKDEITKMINDAEIYKENDNKIKECIDAKNSLENYIASVQRLLCTEKFKSDVGDEKIKELVNIVQDITDWIEDVEENNENLSKEDYDIQYKVLQDFVINLLS